MELDPLAVALKFGFIAVLYLFLLWVARSAWRELKRSDPARAAAFVEDDGATAMHRAGSGIAAGGREAGRPTPMLVVASAPGFSAGDTWDVDDELVLGRGGAAHVVLQDSFSSSRHARLTPQGEAVVLEDLGSTNGTFLNGAPLTGPQPLHDGDRIRIGDSEFQFER